MNEEKDVKEFIYVITNTQNGKQYVGQTNNPHKRWMAHKNQGKISEYPLYRAMRKYGIDSFKFEIIEETTTDFVNEREVYWIKQLNSLSPNGYNLTPGGEALYGENNPFYGKCHTEETKKILSEKHKGIYNGENNPMYGKHHTDESKQKIIQKNLDKNMYEHHRQRMKNNRAWENSVPIKPIVAINHDEKKILLFYTIAQAGRYVKQIGLSKAKWPHNIIKKYLKNDNLKGKIIYGFQWIYAHELINNVFAYRGWFVSGQSVNYLTSIKEDKIILLLKPYFSQNKDEVINLSEYYEEINKKIEITRLLHTNIAKYIYENN